jgi:hypothetical protein
MDLVWNLDFERKLISGKVTYDVGIESPAAKNLASFLKIAIGSC